MQHKQPALAGFRRNALALAVATTLPVGTVCAQEIKELPTAQVSAHSEESYKVEESTSIKYTQPLLDTAKTITVIPASVMKDRNIDSLRDALRNVPGISMAAGEGGTPTGDSMSIRGFSARNNIMIDGVRDIAGYSRDIYNVEAVEVAKGPGSAVYGRGATGGSINLATKTAKLDEFNDVSLHLGSESDYRAKLDSNIKLGETTALRINLLSDDVDVAGRDEVNNSKNALALSFANGLGTDSRLSVNAEYQKQNNMPDYGLPWVSNYSGRDDRTIHADIAEFEGKAPPVDFSNFYGNVHRDFEDVTAQSITAKYEKDLNNTTTLRVLGRVGSVERLSIVSAPRFSYETVDEIRVYGEGAQIGLNGEKTRDTKDALSVLQVDLLGQYQTGSIQHDVVAGFEIAKEKFDRWNYEDVIADNLDTTPEFTDLYNPDAHVAYTGQYARTSKDQKATGDTTAIYVFDTIKLNTQWQLSAGVRYDIFETEYFYQLDHEEEPDTKLDAKEKELSWNLGVVYKPTDNSSLYFAAGNSFSPSAEDLTASSRGNNAELDPEETMSYELGAKWEPIDGRLFTSVAIFRTEKNHARTDDPYAEDARDDTLAGEQRVDGLELSMAGQITEQFSLTAAYTFQDSEVINAEGDDKVQEGHELSRTPEHSFSVWSRYEINQKFALGMGAQYVDERFNSSDPGGRETADDYLIFDMMVSYQIHDKWSAQLNVNNLTDKAYIDQIGGGHFVPGAGRYLTLSTSYSF